MSSVMCQVLVKKSLIRHGVLVKKCQERTVSHFKKTSGHVRSLRDSKILSNIFLLLYELIFNRNDSFILSLNLAKAASIIFVGMALFFSDGSLKFDYKIHYKQALTNP